MNISVLPGHGVKNYPLMCIHKEEKQTFSTASWSSTNLFCNRYKELCHTAMQGN